MNQYDFKNDKSINFSYNNYDFPVLIVKNYETYANPAFLNHWHTEIEFFYVLSGKMICTCGGKQIELNKDEGIFFNSAQMHGAYVEEPSSHICILFHPVILSSSGYIEKKYILPVIQNEAVPFFVLKSSVPWQKEVLDCIYRAYQYSAENASEMKLQGCLFEIWQLMYDNLSTDESKISEHSNQYISLLKDMILYIHDHYTERVSLSDICSIGNVGKTTCYAIFDKYTSMTPIEFLINYRLQKSIELMMNTDLSIADIAFDVGFTNVSYFTKTFHRVIGASPSKYRKLKTNAERQNA